MVDVAQYDFVALDYVGRIKEGDRVFDVTTESDARKYGLYDKKMHYIPRVVGVGLGYVISGLDASLLNKKVGETYTVLVASAQAFGPRDTRLIQVVSTQTLLKQKIRPLVGLTIYAGNRIGVIRAVTGGRTTVDFNHPLAGKDLEYTVTLVKKIDDVREKVTSLLGHGLRLAPTDFTLALDEQKKVLSISLKKKILENVKKNFVALCTQVPLGISVQFS